MAYRIYVFCLMTFPVFFSSCLEKKRSISAICEQGLQGNFEIKWEIYPEPQDAKVSIYTSNNDSTLWSSYPIMARSDDYIAVINFPDPDSRQYFKLKVEGASSGIITNRFFMFDSIQNFRDVGGYYTSDNRQVRWGKLFRAGSLSRSTQHDHQLITRLNIVTNININMLLNDEEISNPLHVDNYVRLPIGDNGFEQIIPKIEDNQFLRGDAVLFIQDFYKDMVENYTSQFARFFDYLLDESNYPIVYNCYFGKAQTGLATYFILRALDVPVDVVEEDYLESNRGIDKHRLGFRVDSLSESGQEALTLITNTDIAYLRYAIACVKKKYGSVDAYLEKALNITKNKKERLRQILLYPENKD